MNLHFRRMTAQDIVEVYKIECDLFRNPWSYESFLRDVNADRISNAFVVENDQEIVGYAVCWKYSRELHIGNIAVSREWQRQGIGSFILQQIMENFNNTEISYLEVRESNIPAINLYKKYGFETFYSRKSYYPDGENALVMVKKMS